MQEDLHKHLMADVLGGLPGVVEKFFPSGGLADFKLKNVEIQSYYCDMISELESYSEKLQTAVYCFENLL